MLVVLAATIGAGAATAAKPSLPLPVLEFDLDAGVLPKSLPKKELSPVRVSISSQIGTRDGSHPSALREAVVAVEKDLDIDVTGLSACGYRRVARRDTEQVRRSCRKAIVGKGEGTILASYPENTPIRLPSEITVLNGGKESGTTTLFAHAFIPIPTPRAIVAQIKISRKGRGWVGTVKVPRLTDGFGALTELSLSLRRSFFDRARRRSFISASCLDGKLAVTVPKILFRNEARIPGVGAQTVLKGGLAIPCRPKG